MIGASAMRFQQRIDSGEQVVVGVNKYRADDDAEHRPPVGRPDPEAMRRHRDEFIAAKSRRSRATVARALDGLTRAVEQSDGNVFAAVVEGARAGLSNEEICARLRRDLGFGQPLVVV
jgi:methylmalonyl-CoA mutase N-terminal domain/subunit